jgi:intergrase/recombinase
MAKNCSRNYARDKLRYAKQYASCLFEGDFSELQQFSESKRNHVMCALSSLAKFLGKYHEFKRLVEAYGLKWKSVNAEDLLLSRMNKVEKEGSVLGWVEEVKRKRPELSTFLDFMLATGLRRVEAIRSYNLIIELSQKGGLENYYDKESEALEHFKFKKMFMRRTKKAFISFVPNHLVEKIQGQEKLTKSILKNRIQRSGLPLRFGDIREYFATYMTKVLTQSEIDFLQGRVSASVFMKHYFNPALLGDLKERVFKGIEELQVLS